MIENYRASPKSQLLWPCTWRLRYLSRVRDQSVLANIADLRGLVQGKMGVKSLWFSRTAQYLDDFSLVVEYNNL
jgi:hypothetical protein